MILKPNPDILQKDLEALNNRIKYEPSGIEIFDKLANILSIEELSNYEKHREAWKRILKEPSSDVFMVIEDDAFIIPDASCSLQQLWSIDHSSYDMVFTCLSDNSAKPNDPVKLLNFRDTGSVLPSKDTYLISQSAAASMLAATETISFHMRIQMSFVIHKMPSLKVYYPSKRMMLEGSKLGLYTSSVHPNNTLIYNQEYMQLWKLMQQEHVPIKEVRTIYNSVAHINNPDIQHLYGVLLYKAKQIKEAEEALTLAVEQMQKQHGVLTYRSDLLNNLINMQEFVQWDLEEISKQPSKYARRPPSCATN
jgi:hypothetical protein